MTPYEALYGRKCRTPICWDDVTRTRNGGGDYKEDKGRRALEFEVGEKVLLKVSPAKGVMRFGKKGKLSPRFISPYEVLERIGEVAYRLALPMNLAKVHNVFHVSQLRKYVHDPSHIIQPETIELDKTLTFEKEPIKTLDTKTRCTRNKEITWTNQQTEEATWETEVDMRKRYPELFEQIVDGI
ncbi:uncharacterized protein LOC130813534 [Amaranthus tricolor]|uniref:uncharacterized protein LOC130813534 n=1 Tax=Amaranthus tricolor TaxID=29722 RepID=UPI00258ECDD6|nr:uncharacterized protein LOC130813534 [Amaranthus tricolor]